MGPRKPLFIKGPSPFVRLVLLAILSVALMMLDSRGQHLQQVRVALGTVLYPLQYAVHLPIRAGDWMAENLHSRKALREELDMLRTEHLRLKARLEKYAELEAENTRLRHLLDSAERLGDKVLIAELLAVDMHPFSRRVVLDKGRNDGVYPGQSLIDSFGIMGQVETAGPISSHALLITDPNHAIPVQVHRSGLRAVAVGAGSLNMIKLDHVPNSADIQIGDKLVTSGLGGRFPRGYPVGTVESIVRNSGRPFAEIMVRPSAKLERNREVLLVWPQGRGKVMDSSYTPNGSMRRSAHRGAHARRVSQ
ncbi:MAG: rod shape-determining protein MreC [Gammaproteobacteria bacterium]|nr:rod shape-determining protein MreC [Gammaproteobacteria bacterium]